MARALETACIAMLGLAACYSPSQPLCGFYCGPDGACPEDYTCNSENRCRLNSAPASETCSSDAAMAILDSSRPPDTIPDADLTAPMVKSTAPANGAVGVSRTTAIIVEFDEPVSNVSYLTFTVFAPGSVAGTVMVVGGSVVDYKSYQFFPSNMLPPNQTVTVNLTGAIHDFAGNSLVTPSPGDYSFNFMTGP